MTRYENKQALTERAQADLWPWSLPPEPYIGPCVVRCAQADGSVALIRFGMMTETRFINRCRKLWGRGRLVRLTMQRYEWRRH